jgi:hypothetical protein
VITARAQCREAVACAEAIILAQLGKDAGAFRLVGSPTTEEPYGTGVKHDDQAFRSFVDDLLEKAYSNGHGAAAYAAFGRFGWKTPALAGRPLRHAARVAFSSSPLSR